jgi:hypothetical protein
LPRFQPEEILRTLERYRVRYVLIGGVAATLHGSPLPTRDADLCPSREDENLDRLAAALRDMGSRIRTPDAPEGVPFACDAAFLRQMKKMLNLRTSSARRKRRTARRIARPCQRFGCSSRRSANGVEVEIPPAGKAAQAGGASGRIATRLTSRTGIAGI